MMDEIDSSNPEDYTTTYSQDERRDQYLKEKRVAEFQEKRNELLLRQQYFEEFYDEQIIDEESIFNLPGMKFITFDHLKIKFSFHAQGVAKYVSQRCKFCFTLHYNGRWWGIKRNSAPLPYKKRVYKLFYSKNCVTDEIVLETIMKIYMIMCKWSKEEEAYRKDKYRRFRRGEDVIIDSEDEELFFSEDEIEEMHKKRQKILQRMIPPENSRRRLRPCRL